LSTFSKAYKPCAGVSIEDFSILIELWQSTHYCWYVLSQQSTYLMYNLVGGDHENAYSLYASENVDNN